MSHVSIASEEPLLESSEGKANTETNPTSTNNPIQASTTPILGLEEADIFFGDATELLEYRGLDDNSESKI